ncbi:MAG: HAD family hydrolase [Candidatus Liptonbacteria bacterium]|nr:HAD family hydrolase [Candidatus Liptonbacteria bacterium]
MRAVFLDRDGVINKEVDVLRRLSQLKILPGVAKAIKQINKLGFLTIIVTNQPVIARGWLTEKQVEHIHDVLIKRLAKQGAKIDAIYYCPHHPNANLKKYRKNCSCRKPKPGMILKAMKKFGISRRGSFMVGDHAWDIMAGKAAGLKTIFVKSSVRSNDPQFAHVKPNFVGKNLLNAVKIISHES